MIYKLSVIVPVYNTERYLLQCVNSLLEQTLTEIEIILVDDQSPDNAGVICDELVSKHKSVKVIHKKNEGLGLARNSGLEAATGKYVAFVDSDDYVDRDFYQKLFEYAEDNNADICFSAGFKRFHEKKVDEYRYRSMALTLLDSHSEIQAAVPRIISNAPGTDDVLPGSACMSIYRLDFLLKNDLRFISERKFISEDIWFNMDCLYKANRVFFSDTTGYNYRYNANSLSHDYKPNRFSLLYDSVEMILKRCEELTLKDYYGRIALYFWVNFEKCINQEVRFNKKDAIKTISIMCRKPMSQKWMDYLKDKKFSGQFHILLCKHLYKGNYRLVYILLTIYNQIVH